MTILAYIDPGLGALIWQTIVAGFVGLFFYLRKTRLWIVNTCLKMAGRGRQSPTTTPAVPLEIPAAKKEPNIVIPK